MPKSQTDNIVNLIPADAILLNSYRYFFLHKTTNVSNELRRAVVHKYYDIPSLPTLGLTSCLHLGLGVMLVFVGFERTSVGWLRQRANEQLS